MTDPRNFLFHSDYPQIYIGRVLSGDFTVEAGQWDYTHKIEHGLPFVPLLRGIWSDTDSFDWANDFAVFSKEGFKNYPEVGIDEAWADKTYLYIKGINNVWPEKNVRYFYRIVCLVPPDYKGEVPEYDIKEKFTFLSTRRYHKLFKIGILPKEGGKVDHDLGYLPIVWVFDKNRGCVSNTITSSSELVINENSFSIGENEKGNPYVYIILGDDYA